MDKHTVAIDAATYERITRIIEAADKYPHISRAFSESDMIQLAMIMLEAATFIPLEGMPAITLLRFSIDKFEKAKASE